MDIFSEFICVPAIVVITYLVATAVKAFDGINNKHIPVICGTVGAILGIIGLYIVPSFPADDYLNAIAVGIVSGFGATGINQIVKQYTNSEGIDE